MLSDVSPSEFTGCRPEREEDYILQLYQKYFELRLAPEKKQKTTKKQKYEPAPTNCISHVSAEYSVTAMTNLVKPAVLTYESHQ